MTILRYYTKAKCVCFSFAGQLLIASWVFPCSRGVYWMTIDWVEIMSSRNEINVADWNSQWFNWNGYFSDVTLTAVMFDWALINLWFTITKPASPVNLYPTRNYHKLIRFLYGWGNAEIFFHVAVHPVINLSSVLGVQPTGSSSKVRLFAAWKD